MRYAEAIKYFYFWNLPTSSEGREATTGKMRLLFTGYINADNGLSFLALSTDSHKKVNLANSDTLLSTVCCLKTHLSFMKVKKTFS